MMIRLSKSQDDHRMMMRMYSSQDDAMMIVSIERHGISRLKGTVASKKVALWHRVKCV